MEEKEQKAESGGENPHRISGKTPPCTDFFTPKRWVDVSMKHLALVFGENWLDEYYVWDCVGGIGETSICLNKPERIWISVRGKNNHRTVMKKIKNGAPLLENRLFRFDLRTDGFDQLPQELLEIINDEEKRGKLIIYINIPVMRMEKPEDRMSVFMILKRFYDEIYGCKIACFSNLKILTSADCEDFRKRFRAELKNLFLFPAFTICNYAENSAIGFYVWDAGKDVPIKEITADIYRSAGDLYTKKQIYPYDKTLSIGEWIKNYRDGGEGLKIAALNYRGDQLKNADKIFFDQYFVESNTRLIVTQHNLIPACVFFAVRHCVVPYWLNIYDAFVRPNDKWEEDGEFWGDCVIYSIFHLQNYISFKHGINYWIPFSEEEVGAAGTFYRDFMRVFLAGGIKADNAVAAKISGISSRYNVSPSVRAQAVLDAGRELRRYYHEQKKAPLDAAFHDIREFFQGHDENGRIKRGCLDERYNELITNLCRKQSVLAKKIAAKVYEYGFLRR